MTQEQLAKVAHVSVSTISKAFNNSPEISYQTREYIFKIAKEHGCFDKYYKDQYKRPLIGVIAPELISHYYSEYVSILESMLSPHNATVLIGTTGHASHKAEELLTYFTSFAKVNAIILIDTPIDSNYKCSVPLFSVNPTNNDTCTYTRLRLNNAIRDAIKHLMENGHTKIGFIGETHAYKKEDLFRKAMDFYKLPMNENWIINRQERYEHAGVKGIEQLLSQPELPTALVCAYDHVAFGAIHRLRQESISVPEDISIIGMDNIEQFSYLSIPLTSIDLHKQEICKTVVDNLVHKLKNPFHNCTSSDIYASLIVRGTVKNINTK